MGHYELIQKLELFLSLSFKPFSFCWCCSYFKFKTYASGVCWLLLLLFLPFITKSTSFCRQTPNANKLSIYIPKYCKHFLIEIVLFYLTNVPFIYWPNISVLTGFAQSFSIQNYCGVFQAWNLSDKVTSDDFSMKALLLSELHDTCISDKLSCSCCVVIAAFS